MIPKRFTKKIDREKFDTYRKFFFACAALFFFSMIGEMLLFGSGTYHVLPEMREATACFLVLFPMEALGCLFLFLSGVTVYGPFAALFLSALRGALSGFCLFLLLPPKEGAGWAMLLLLFFYLLLSAWLSLSYGAFCACTSLRLFSPPRSLRGKKMFGGTLFYAPYFEASINLRFLFSYLLFFFFALVLSGGLSLLYALLRALI